MQSVSEGFRSNRKSNRKSNKKAKKALTNNTKSEQIAKKEIIQKYELDSNTKINITTFLISVGMLITIFIITVLNSEKITTDETTLNRFGYAVALIGFVLLVSAFSIALDINAGTYKGELKPGKLFIFTEKIFGPLFLVFTGLIFKTKLSDFFSGLFGTDGLEQIFTGFNLETAINLATIAITIFYIFMMIIVWLN